MKKIGALLSVISFAGMLLLSAGCEESSREAAGPEESGWKLVFRDDFDRGELGDDWEVVEGEWKVEDGTLRDTGTLISARGFSGESDPDRPDDYRPAFQRLEFEARTDLQPRPPAPPLAIPGFPTDEEEPSVCDLSSFIHAAPSEDSDAPWRTGYFFQFGGHRNTLNRITRAGADLVADEDPDVLIAEDKLHSIAVENDEGHLRFFVDGELLYEHREEFSIIGEGQDRVGFYFFKPDTIVEEVRVYIKTLPRDDI